MDCLAEKKQSLDFSADRPCSEFFICCNGTRIIRSRP